MQDTLQELESKADKCLKSMNDPNLNFLKPLLAMQYKQLLFEINELKEKVEE